MMDRPDIHQYDDSAPWIFVLLAILVALFFGWRAIWPSDGSLLHTHAWKLSDLQVRHIERRIAEIEEQVQPYKRCMDSEKCTLTQSESGEWWQLLKLYSAFEKQLEKYHESKQPADCEADPQNPECWNRH